MNSSASCGFCARYERIQPRVGLDLLAYIPEEFDAIRERPFLRQALQEGRVLYET